MSRGKPPDPPEGDKNPNQHPGQVTVGTAWAVNGAPGGTDCRSFQQIIEEEKMKRNIIEIKLVKSESESDMSGPRSLSYDDLGELIFDVIKIDPKDCIAFDYNTGRIDVKQIQLRPGVNTDTFVTSMPISFKGYDVSVMKQLNNVTRVTFKNVPLNVPNEEILHLCRSYGTPCNNKVIYETLTNSRNKGMIGSTRFVDMEFARGKSMMNYYWLEGPLSGDQGRRVLVLHNGQIAQCSHCLKRAGEGGCQAGGNGKACKLLETPRGKMLSYMQNLRTEVGYVSLKNKYLEHMAANFPSLPGFDSETPNQMDDSEELVYTNLSTDEKDQQISVLQKQVLDLQTKEKENTELKTDLSKVKDDLSTYRRKLNFTKKATEQRLLDNIANPDGFQSDPLLIGVYSATLN